MAAGTAGRPTPSQGTWASTISVGFTTTTTSRSKGTQVSRSQKVSRRDSWHRGGTFCALVTPMTSIGSNAPLRFSGRRRKDRPSSFWIAYIGYGSPHRQDTPEAHGEPLGDDEVRLTKRAYDWPGDAKFLVPDAVYGHFTPGVDARGIRPGLKGRACARFRCRSSAVADLASGRRTLGRALGPAKNQLSVGILDW